MNHPYSWIEDSLKTLHRANWYRRVKTIQGRGGAVIEAKTQRKSSFVVKPLKRSEIQLTVEIP